MLLNVSYNDKTVQKKINDEVGKPFSLRERIRMGGIGSPKLIIKGASIHIHNLLILDQNRNTCNIELRPGGIIIGFRALLDSYGLIIPYHKLSLYKGGAKEYTLYRDTYYIRVTAKEHEQAIHRFMNRLLENKATASPPRPGAF